MEFNKTSKSYLEWEEYVKMIREKEYRDFIVSTARQSLRNLASKEELT